MNQVKGQTQRILKLEQVLKKTQNPTFYFYVFQRQNWGPEMKVWLKDWLKVWELVNMKHTLVPTLWPLVGPCDHCPIVLCKN